MKTSRFSALLALVIAANAPLHARQAPAASSPSWSPAPLFPASSLRLKTLPNGTRVLSRATAGTGLVCVQVWARAGSRFESTNESGAAHIIEAAALRASRAFPRTTSVLEGGAARAIEALGGQLSSQTSRDSTFYSATVAANYLPQALNALADATLRPDLSDAAVEQAKSGVLLVQQEREENPLTAVADLAYRAAFTKHPYAKPAGGSSLSVETLAPSRVRAYHKKIYVGRSLSVVIVGDIQPASAHTLAARAFAAASSTAPPKIAIAAEIVPRDFQTVARRRPINRAALALAFQAPPVAKAEDVVAVDVLLALWREGSQAPMRRALLTPRDRLNQPPQPNAPEPEDEGEPPLALAYDMDFLTQRDPSLFIVTMALEPADKPEAIDAVMREIARVQDDIVSEAELQRAKNLLTEQFLTQSEGVSGQASSLGFYDMIDSYEFALKYLPRIQRITRDDLRRVAKTYFSRTKYLQASIEPLPPERIPNRNSPTITASIGF